MNQRPCDTESNGNQLVYQGHVCGPEYGADEHVAYRATLSKALLERIASLSAHMHRLGVASLSFADSAISAYSRWPDGMPTAIVHGDCEPEENCQQDSFDAQKHAVHADMPKINLYLRVDFSWSWYPKHGGRSQRCESDMFRLSQVLADWNERFADDPVRIGQINSMDVNRVRA